MSELEEIKNRIDIVELIGGYVQLTKTGKNFKGCCPFHNEKTPSFIVSPERQSWHCFGACNEGGDIFTFVQKMDGLSFPEAIETLAAKAGVKIEKKNFERNETKSKYYNANGLAADFYYTNLLSEPGKKALDYLIKNRGLKKETIAAFSLGWSTAEKGALQNELVKHNYKTQELLESGLVANKSGEWRDLFWNRLMFPIRDISGRTIGFSARVLDDSLPKYINTPETEIYHKSNILYGIDLAKESIRKLDYAIVVEGNMDVIGSHQAGVKNVVASSGTALTENQLLLLARLTKNLKLAFDVDFAGSQATRRAIELAWQLGFNIKVITIPAGKDPADAAKENPEIWKKAVKDAVYVIDYLFESVLSQHNKKDPMGRKYIAKELLPVIRRIPDEIEKDTYIKRLAKELAVEPSSIIGALQKISDPKKTVVPPKTEGKPQIENKSVELERNIVGLLLLEPHYLDFASTTLGDDDFTDSEIGKDFEKMLKYYNKKGQISEGQFLASLGKDSKERFGLYLLSAENSFSDLEDEKRAEEIYFGIKRLKKISLETKKKKLSLEIAGFESQKNKKEAQRTLEEFQLLLEEERNLN